MKHISITTQVEQYNNEQELAKNDRDLILAARKAAQTAYAPYSNFKVGAALLLQDGTIVTGSNQENAAYPSGLCAERTAIFWANAQHPELAVKSIAITAIKHNSLISAPLSPCGSCRQVMLETEMRYNTEMRVILDSSNDILIVKSARALLPLSFDAKSLE